MSIISLRPRTTQFYRYKPEEMSGSLPPVLYKVLPAVYAKRLVDRGEMMWSTLTWFQHQEDVDRGDRLEGTHTYFPVSGLDVTREEHNGRPDHSTFNMPSHGLLSRAAQSNHIFIYSMTMDANLAIGDAETRVCVEVFDPAGLVQRVRTAIRRHRKAQEQTLIHNGVTYWASANPPEAVWALPHLLTMFKHEDYAHQREYRLAFGTRADVFDFERVECFVVDDGFRLSHQRLDPQCHRMKLRLGSLAHYCRFI